VQHASLSRQQLLAFPKPVLIRGATESWAARKAWTLDALLATHNDTVFHASPHGETTLGDLLRMEDAYHTGQMGMKEDCYVDSGGIGAPACDGKRGVLKSYERPYSPFMHARAGKDYNVPGYFLPARLLYMGIGHGNGGGVRPEEHPSAWFASAVGRKRWLVHPPNLIGPKSAFSRPSCDVTHVYTSTLMCDQQPGDIIWLPGGWWHETCNLDPFSAGVGGVTYKEVEEKPKQRDRGKCNLGKDPELNKLLRHRSGGDSPEYSTEDVPYCKQHHCPLLPTPGLQFGLRSLAERVKSVLSR